MICGSGMFEAVEDEKEPLSPRGLYIDGEIRRKPKTVNWRGDAITVHRHRPTAPPALKKQQSKAKDQLQPILAKARSIHSSSPPNLRKKSSKAPPMLRKKSSKSPPNPRKKSTVSSRYQLTQARLAKSQRRLESPKDLIWPRETGPFVQPFLFVNQKVAAGQKPKHVTDEEKEEKPYMRPTDLAELLEVMNTEKYKPQPPAFHPPTYGGCGFLVSVTEEGIKFTRRNDFSEIKGRPMASKRCVWCTKMWTSAQDWVHWRKTGKKMKGRDVVGPSSFNKANGNFGDDRPIHGRGGYMNIMNHGQGYMEVNPLIDSDDEDFSGYAGYI